jgi:integrase
LSDGSYVVPTKVTLREYLEGEWLPAIVGTVRPLTLTQYTSIVNRRIVPRLGSLRLQAVTGGHLNAFYRELEEAGLSPASRRLTHAVLSRAFRDAIRWGKLTRSPAAAADPPAPAESRAQAWTAKELGRFLEPLGSDRLFALWRLAATTGMRRGELLGLTWLTLDLEGGTLRVDQQLVPTRGGMSFGPPKSKRSRRKIALDAETVETLRAHREAQLLERAFVSDAYVDRDLVFCNELGGPINPTRLTEAFTRHRKTAGIPTGTLHILRHTHTTHALSSGVPVHVVAARIGDRPETVLKTYAHLLPTSDAEAAEQVAALIA